MTAKRLGSGTEAYNSTGFNVNHAVQISKPAALASATDEYKNKGHNNSICTGPNVQSLLKDQDEDYNKSVHMNQASGPHSIGNQNLNSNISLIGTEKPGDVAIRINKINIAI